ncbi:MAG: Nucleoside triphosphate pyrophosphohydrolase MazG [Micavibrio sp.]|nr:Nucleoside triphosphate pyrophosphohydrolase MazG [Micavibrio sp.]
MKTTGIQALTDVMTRLRDPETGCPWDIVQTFETIAPYTIEEAYEVADAINSGDMNHVKEELGDLLLQVVFHAQMASEQGLFDFDDVAAAVAAKMISRHPHVFGDKSAKTAGDVIDIWEDQKDKERARKPKEVQSILDDVPLALPAIMRAQKLQKRAARVGFEWEKAVDVLDKLEEEIAELRAAIGSKDPKEIHGEIGDMMFCVVNFGRMLDVDCEQSLRDTNDKFKRRFNGIENDLKQRNKQFTEMSLQELEQIWQAQKLKERA